MSARIEDYALIGDCHTAALVSREGSVDWLCFPRFDSPACFAALLGTRDHGRWLITPANQVRTIRRQYRPGTLVLETEFETESGAVSIVDYMPPRTHELNLVRMVVGKRGQVPMRMELIIRFDYGSIVPWVRRTEDGIRAIAGPDALRLHTPVELRGQEMTTVADFTIAEGQQLPFVLMWHPAHEPRPRALDPVQALELTEMWWRKWSGRCKFEGCWREAVLRSLITLKALTYAPTGGIVAAPTTSLPELIGGVRNWDYRFSWVRDATFTLYAMLLAGYTDEAKAWREWLLDAVAGTPAQMNIMYGVAGERRLTELELDWLPGYENSRPVRIGNAAWKQFQLDVFGEVLDALHVARRAGVKPDENAWQVQLALAGFLETAWKNPDEGIWEIRGPKQHFTHSKVMAWVAFDRIIKGVERSGLQGPVEKWRKTRDEIHREVCQRGYDSSRNCFVQYYGSKDLDASLLMMPLVGFLPATDPRMRGTIEAIEKHLTTDGFVARYPTENGVDGLPKGEGAFLPCSFWLADNLFLMGRHDEARNLFEKLLQIRNDVGLLSEEYDPVTRRQLGNFPQAMSHVSLINTAHNLSPGGGPAEHRQGA